MHNECYVTAKDPRYTPIIDALEFFIKAFELYLAIKRNITE